MKTTFDVHSPEVIDESGAPAPRSDSPLQEGSLERLRKLGGDRLVGRLIEIFGSNGSQHVDRMLEGSAAGDTECVARSGHALISTAGNVGATRLQEMATELARTAGTVDPQVRRRVAALAEEFERVREWLAQQ